MRFSSYVMIVSLLLTAKTGYMQTDTAMRTSTYFVERVEKPIKIDGDWNKPEWQNAPVINVVNHMGDMPRFVPVVNAKLKYDNDNLYLMFRVEDRYVKSTVTKVNGPVSENSCVEFFFSPDVSNPLHYFNLEINAGGTPLIFFVTKPWTGYRELEEKDIRNIEIAHSMPKVIDPEITDPITWTIEARIPLAVLRKYSAVTQPAPGVKWKANFYKTGSETSNPNYMTWSVVQHPKPNFHLPEYFGTIIFR
jgi:hypothetical protein